VGYFLPSLQRRWSRREVAWVSPFGVQVLSLSSGILCACQLRQCRCMLSLSLFFSSFIKSLTKEEDHDDDEEEYLVSLAQCCLFWSIYVIIAKMAMTP
jgi:hypothetical protein